METYEFSVIASGLDPRADDFEDRFYNAGCDDALIAFQKGHIIIDFARKAASIEDAIASAVDNVRATGATVDRVEPDPLVSLSDIAARTGLTRAAVSQYFTGARGKGFPAPSVRVTADTPLWDWPLVARWMFSNGKIRREQVVEAEVVKEANAAIGAGEFQLLDRLKRFVRDLNLNHRHP